jgi:hypothetical protein
VLLQGSRAGLNHSGVLVTDNTDTLHMRGSNRRSEVRGDNACGKDETHTGVANPIRRYADLVLSSCTIAFNATP